MYTPATRQFGTQPFKERYGGALSSLAFCLEDSIQESALEEAELVLRRTLVLIRDGRLDPGGTLLFVRVRDVAHLHQLRNFLYGVESVLTGYVLPKFDLTNAEAYVRELESWDTMQENPLWVMPILESAAVADVSHRASQLSELQGILSTVRPRVLNLRVGGNDLCNLYGVRRGVRDTIYDISAVRAVLGDIVSVFAGEYVISGPVWEYFGQDPEGDWAHGLRRELALDRLNGFIGKTAIHPSQLPVILESMRVSRQDYEDAVRILSWEDDSLGVARSADGSRMNEVSCHTAWAEKIALLGQIYGIREEGV
ncbi:MAG: HpcH/HpaI aldolase/citrate lyase family protein [Clostridia bacterium]|nr:HpcH/HpaI aldolase/citrate lyase family protein [Clostridia bacterium]